MMNAKRIISASRIGNVINTRGKESIFQHLVVSSRDNLFGLLLEAILQAGCLVAILYKVHTNKPVSAEMWN